MISVILATRDEGRLLVPTLAALVAGSAAGLVRDVLIADAGADDETAEIADAAGCVYLRGPADPGARLRAAAAAARGNWLLFLEPGSVLEEGWIREVRAFMDGAERSGASRAATFRLRLERFGVAPRLAEAAAATRLALIGRPRPEQGLLLAKRFYQALGGHGDGAAAHRRLVGRIGRRIVLLRTGIVLARDT